MRRSESKSKYEKMNITGKLNSIKGWTEHGCSVRQIAGKLGVSESTMYKWRSEHEELRIAMDTGKEIADGELVNAAFRIATGYTTTEKTPMKIRVQKTQEDGRVIVVDEIVMVESEKIVQPNEGMLKFLLINRIPEAYKSKVDAVIGGSVGISEEDRKLLKALDGFKNA